MALIVSEFLQIIGVDLAEPITWVDWMQYQLVIYIGVALVTGVFRVIGKLAEFVAGWRRW